MTRSINQTFRANRGGGPPAFITGQNRKQLAPFVLFDAGNQQKEDWLRIGWHPHSGVATLTLPYGANLHHSDTGGNGGEIKDGGFQWMASGGGIWHKEEYEPVNGEIGILQLWVQLPPEEESGPVKYFNLQPEDISTNENTRVILGEFNGVTSPAKVPVEVTYLDVSLSAGEVWKFQPPANQLKGFVFPKKGSVIIEETLVEEEVMGMFEESDQAIIIQAKTNTQFVVALIAPSPYPIVHEYGQMHTNREALDQAKVTIQKLGQALRQQGQI